MNVRSGAAIIAAMMASAGCNAATSNDAGPPIDSIDLPHIVLSAVLPSVKFYVERTGDRCITYSEDNGARSPTVDAPCVQDLLIGERIRWLGSTCEREGASPNRTLPVMCPNELARFVHDATTRAAASTAPRASRAAPSAKPTTNPSAPPMIPPVKRTLR